MNFNQRLRSLRLSHGLTQSELSKILHYGYTAISNYESGRNEPSISDLKIIADFFHVSLDYLLGYTETASIYRKKRIRVKNEFVQFSLQLAEARPLLTKEKLVLLSNFLQWLKQAPLC